MTDRRERQVSDSVADSKWAIGRGLFCSRCEVAILFSDVQGTVACDCDDENLQMRITIDGDKLSIYVPGGEHVMDIVNREILTVLPPGSYFQPHVYGKVI